MSEEPKEPKAQGDELTRCPINLFSEEQIFKLYKV